LELLADFGVDVAEGAEAVVRGAASLGGKAEKSKPGAFKAKAAAAIACTD